MHEVAAGLIPAGVAPPSAVREIVSRVRIARIELRPIATPSPRPLRAVAHLLPAPRVLAMRPSGAVRSIAARARPSQPVQTKPVWDLAGSIAPAGAGTLSGPLGGTNGNGSAVRVAGGDEPCGFVTFSDPHGSQFDSRTRGFRVDIRMSVHFADGSIQSTMLDYPWYYASEAENPWSDRNLADPNFPTRFQPPPPGKIANEPELVKYVAQHSTSDGLTLLRDCPTATPPA